MNVVKPSYLSYLLRIWQSDAPGEAAWVASLENPHTHQMLHFNNLDDLAQFLRASTQLKEPPEDVGKPGQHMPGGNLSNHKNL